MKSLEDALQSAVNPLLEFRRLTAPKPAVNAGVVHITACPPKAARNANYRPRRGRFQHYVEEWAPNVDGSGFSDAHDAVAGRRRNDLEAVEETSGIVAAGVQDCKDMEDAAHRNRKPLSLSQIQKLLRDSKPIPTEHSEAVKLEPARSKRDLLMKTSRRQRLIMRAFRLTQQGMAWDDMAGALGITQSEARSMRRLVVGLLGSSALRKPNTQPRDPETKQFVGCNTARPQPPKRLKGRGLSPRPSISATPTAQ